MTPKDGKTLYDTLDTLSTGTDVPVGEDEFSLEEILAEYGGGLGRRLMKDAEPAEDTPQPQSAAAQAEPRDKPELPRSPRPISLEEVVGSTVEAVMEERQEPQLKRRRGLFSRRTLEETEELYPTPKDEAPEPEEEEAEPIGPEPEPWEAADRFRTAWHRSRGMLGVAAVVALLPTLLLLLDQRGIVLFSFWTEDPKSQSWLLLGFLAVTALLCRSVFVKALRKLGRRRCTAELLISLSALLSGADCVARATLSTRSDAMPYAAVSCLALFFALWGVSRENRGWYDTFRTAAVDDQPPYLVTETEKGACKQRGTLKGFYTTAMGDDAATLWQTAFLPVIFMASLVFAGLTSLGQGRGGDFLLNWSAILAAGGTFALPLCWGLPFSRLAQHLQKTGCAVAGGAGAEKISRRKCMILSDTDLFPPGTVTILNMKTFGEETGKVMAYAATLARCAGSGLERVFDEQLRRQDGSYEAADDFSFFEEGGWSATIRGESVLMGSASFMRKMEVRLPGNLNLKTGVFLAMDRQLAAIFAVKYNAAENVDFALHMMRRSRIVPILASRDPNITPELLKRKFHKGVKVEYPALLVRVALSEAEKDRGVPRALLLREGLLPYAETVAGSRRLCQAVRRAVLLSILGSAAGTLLAAYLVSLGAYDLLTPLAMELFLLLWTAPVLLLADWTGRY